MEAFENQILEEVKKGRQVKVELEKLKIEINTKLSDTLEILKRKMREWNERDRERDDARSAILTVSQVRHC